MKLLLRIMLVAGCGLLLSGCYHNAVLAEMAGEGYPAAQYELGRRMLLGIKGHRRAPDKAIPWLSLSARGGDHRAMAALAVCYERGLGVGKSEQLSRQWYIRAAENGNKDACLALVKMETDKGNTLAATRWLQPVAEAGSVEAQLMCGKLCMAGYAERNPELLAVRYLRFAAMQGNAEACYLMSCCYANGLGVPRNEALMCGWLANAAAGGHAESIELLKQLGEH